MATDKIEIRTGTKDATLRGRRPHKEAPHGPVPLPIWERRRTTTTSDQSPTSPQTRPYPAYLMQKPQPDPKKGVQWQFLHGASQVGDVPVGRMSGSQKPSNFPNPDPSNPSAPTRPQKREHAHKTYFDTTSPSLSLTCWVFAHIPSHLTRPKPESPPHTQHNTR